MPKGNDDDIKMQNELTEIQKKEYIKKQELLRSGLAETRKDARALQADELAKSQFHRDRNGNMVSHWDEAIQKADSAINADVMSYSDWRAAMIGLLNMFSMLVKAMDGTVGKKTAPYRDMIMDDGLATLYHYLKDVVSGVPEMDLASLEHNVQFNDDDTLEIDTLIRSKIEPLIRPDGFDHDGSIRLGLQKLDELFQKGVVNWLEGLGYTPDPANTKKYIDSNGNTLDKAEFNRLKNDPETGLSHYLEENYELSFTQSGLRPS